METISATDAKNRLASVMESAVKSPVMIERNGRPFVVMMSVEEYERTRANRQKDGFIKLCRELSATSGRNGMTGERLRAILSSDN